MIDPGCLVTLGLGRLPEAQGYFSFKTVIHSFSWMPISPFSWGPPSPSPRGSAQSAWVSCIREEACHGCPLTFARDWLEIGHYEDSFEGTLLGTWRNIFSTYWERCWGCDARREVSTSPEVSLSCWTRQAARDCVLWDDGSCESHERKAPVLPCFKFSFVLREAENILLHLCSRCLFSSPWDKQITNPRLSPSLKLFAP